jgi:uncharacterized protein YndB with AHSA1/START domain
MKPTKKYEVPIEKHLFHFSAWYPFAAGLAAGLLLRFLFAGKPGSSWSAMAGAFIYMAPMLVGAVTVYVAECYKRRDWFYYITAPFFSNCIFVLGTLLIMIEGLICAIIIIPLFAAVGAMGGLAMGMVCRLTNWPKQTLSALAVVPLVLGLVGDQLPTPQEFSSIEHSVMIAAPAEIVWKQLVQADNISDHDFKGSWAAHIGVPMPLAGVIEMRPGQSPTGYVRRSEWQKKVYFEGLVTDWQPGQYMRWTYRFFPDSFPPQALDDHVMIGGHYFDLIDTSFRLTPEAGGTRLSIRAHYRVSTQFNFYADRIAQLLMGNLFEIAGKFYQVRSQQAMQITPIGAAVSTSALPGSIRTELSVAHR